MSIDTKELLNKLSKADDIHKFITENESEFLNLSFVDFLNETAYQKELSIADISKKSGQGEYVYKVFRGERKPSRNVVISIAIGMKLCFEETQLLLRISKLATLDPRDKRDSIIIYAINEGQGIDKLNDLLFELKENTL